jgi:hypothetical protein
MRWFHERPLCKPEGCEGREGLLGLRGTACLQVLRHAIARCVSCAGERARACSLGPAVLSSVKAMHDQRRTGANRRSILDTGALLRMGARRFGICIQKCACQGTRLLCGAAVCTLTAPCPCKKPSPKARSNRKRAHCPQLSAVTFSPGLRALALPTSSLSSLPQCSFASYTSCLFGQLNPHHLITNRELLSARQSRRSACEKSTARTTTRRNSLCIAPSSASASASAEFTPAPSRACLFNYRPCRPQRDAVDPDPAFDPAFDSRQLVDHTLC